jgi:RimJ/RimL family protein N-acetyltransferase
MWAVDRRDTGELLGQCGLYLSEKKGPEIELAYHYLPATWGHGYATEAAQVVLDYGFGKLHLDEIIALVMRGNTASSRVVEKAGMRFVTEEATYYDLPRLRKYALTRFEWQYLGTVSTSD